MKNQRAILLVVFGFLTVTFVVAAAFAFFKSRLSLQDSNAVEPLPLGAAPRAVRLTVAEPGIVAVETELLRRTNLPFASSDDINILFQGRQVPIHIVGTESDATIYFYAADQANAMDPPAVYWLMPGAGQHMRQADARPEGEPVSYAKRDRRWEENKVFLGQANGDEAWFGDLLFAPNSLDIPLDNIEPTGGKGILTIQIWSNNQAPPEPDHHVEILLNGRKLADHFWDGIQQETIKVPLAAGDLQPAENVLTISAPGDTGAAGEALYLDWVHLTYEGHLIIEESVLTFRSDADAVQIDGADANTLAFDITDPEAPILLTGGRLQGNELSISVSGPESTYLLASPDHAVRPQIGLVTEREPLTSDARGADYVVIVAEVDGFAEAVQPLIDLRRSQGLRVTSVPANQVYDEFGYGQQTASAIRDFLAHATREWDPAPRFVLLVGDATYDVNGYSGGKNLNLLPTQLVFTEFAGLVASDTWFTIPDDGDLAPVLALGRFPVQTINQLETMVQKTLAYEGWANDDWQARALLVSDDELSFDHASDSLASELDASGFQTQKLYMTKNENIHDEIVSALNQGVGIVNYVGHGSVEVWGDEKVFQNGDADMLTNGRRLPIFTTFTCLNGYFNHPDVDALAETLLWAQDGGVVAAIAPSGRSLTSQQLPLAEVFYRGLLDGETETLGEALRMAKVAGSDNELLRDVIHTFNLLGDPALRFRNPVTKTALETG